MKNDKVLPRKLRCGVCAGLMFGVAFIFAVAWHERHRWSWPATWVSGAITTGMGFLNSNAAALGVLITLGFGILNWREKRRQTRAVLEAAKAGTLRTGEVDE